MKGDRAGSATAKRSVGPTEREIIAAFQAGYRAIDEGHPFIQGFSERLGALGYRRRADSGCTCPDGGWHGHLPECRWTKRRAGGSR